MDFIGFLTLSVKVFINPGQVLTVPLAIFQAVAALLFLMGLLFFLSQWRQSPEIFQNPSVAPLVSVLILLILLGGPKAELVFRRLMLAALPILFPVFFSGAIFLGLDTFFLVRSFARITWLSRFFLLILIGVVFQICNLGILQPTALVKGVLTGVEISLLFSLGKKQGKNIGLLLKPGAIFFMILATYVDKREFIELTQNPSCFLPSLILTFHWAFDWFPTFGLTFGLLSLLIFPIISSPDDTKAGNACAMFLAATVLLRTVGSLLS